MQQGYQQYPYADQRAYYDVNAQQHGLPPQINYQVPHGGAPPQPGYPHGQQYGMPPQAGYPQHQMPTGQQPHHQGAPQMQFQGEHPQQFHSQQLNQAGHPQQQYQGSQQFQAGYQHNPQGSQHQQIPQGHQQVPSGHQQQINPGQLQPQFQANQQPPPPQPNKIAQQGNQQFVSVPPQVPEQKQSADHSINQVIFETFS